MPETEEDRCATGVMIGSGIGGLQTIYDASVLVHEGKARRLSPFFIPSALINLASGHVSIKYGFKGPNHSVGDRLRHRRACDRRRGAADHAGRCRRDGGRRRRSRGLRARHRRVLRLARAVHRLQRPARRAPPARGTRTATASSWARAPACVVLEEYEHAKQRGAKIYAEVSGYGMSGDAHHITAPAEGHEGALPRDAGGAAQRRRRAVATSST